MKLTASTPYTYEELSCLKMAFLYTPLIAFVHVEIVESKVDFLVGLIERKECRMRAWFGLRPRLETWRNNSATFNPRGLLDPSIYQ